MKKYFERFFQKKRTILQAGTFYIITLIVGIGLLIPLISVLITIFSYSQINVPLSFPAICATFYCVIISILILKTKNQKNGLTLLVVGITFLLANFLSLIFALFVPAILTTLPIKEGFYKNGS